MRIGGMDMAEGKVTGFQDILGNDMIKEHFKKAIENHKVSHAYILTGEAGNRAQIHCQCVCDDLTL